MGIQQDLEDLRRVNAELDEQEKTLALRKILKIILIGFLYGREANRKHVISLTKKKEVIQRFDAYFDQLHKLRIKLDDLSKIDAYVARIEEEEYGKQLAGLKDDLKFLVADSSGVLNEFGRYGEEINCCIAKYLELQCRYVEARVKAIVESDTYLIFSEKQNIAEVLKTFSDDLDYFQSKNALVEACNSYRVWVGKYRRTMVDYNKEFLSRRKQQYASLFVKGSYAFDDEQKEAVLTDDRFNLVVAGAGSGKTEALITRIAYLIKRKPDTIQPNRILAIAYQRKDAKQILDRLLHDYAIENVNVMTFHKLGKEILLEAGVKIDRNSLLDENKKPEAIRALYKNRLQEPEYFKLFIEYVKTLHDRDETSPPESKGDSLDYAKCRPYVSINNVHVRSKAEKEILDFFLTHKLNGCSIEVAYEQDVEGFRPDFYLPKYGTFIEHWGLNEKGEVPSWFGQSSEEYKKNKELKKQWFADNNKILIETYAREFDPANPEKFIDLLKDRVIQTVNKLFPAVYDFAPVSYDELVELAWGPYKNQVDEIINFITIAKTFGLTPKRLREKLSEGKWSSKQRVFGELAVQVFDDYESYLLINRKIDFEDLINRAVIELEKYPNLCANLYDQILIDEYQDISAQRYKLIKTLIDRNPSSKLFCVGDDWQSIMAFSGSNLDFFVNFAKYFESPAVIKIFTNYRSVKTIVDAGSELIKRNANCQIAKVTKSNGATGEPIKVLRSPHRESYKKRYFEDMANDCLIRISEYQAAGVLPKDILVLTRFMRTRLNQGYRFHQAIKSLKELAVEKNVDLALDDARNTSKVRVLTAHKSKGLEAKVVFDGMGSVIRRGRSRHTMSALVCGLDVHKDSTYATILDSEGKIVDQARMENENVAAYLSQHKVGRVAMESSTAVAPLYRQLKKEGFDAVVSHPKKTKLIAEAKIKSDRVDSKAIAQLLRMDWLPQSYVPDEVTGALREKVRRRAFLVRERVRLRVKIKSYLTYQGLKWPTDHGLWTKAGIVWLHSLDLAPVESYLRLIDVFSEEIRILSRELEGLAKNDEDVKLLMTIPGIGYYSALLVQSEIGDVGRFPFAEKLCSYAGLVPSTYQSGGVVRHGNITKEGSRWLRWIMMECASTHVSKYDTWISRSYGCLAGRRGKKTARVAAARKLLVVCYSVLKNKKPFHDQP